jgi:hypothetical protein
MGYGADYLDDGGDFIVIAGYFQSDFPHQVRFIAAASPAIAPKLAPIDVKNRNPVQMFLEQSVFHIRKFGGPNGSGYHFHEGFLVRMG